ncbi:MAG: hypothetical protein AAGF20_00255 [Pseudomonadota bacterium]
MDDIGHNNPPHAIDLFQSKIAELKERIDAFPAVTADNEGQANDLIQLASKLSKEIEAKRKDEKQPYLDAGKAIDGSYKPLVDSAKAISAPLKDRLSAHLREQERIARERAAEAARIAEEERKRAEAEAAVSMPADEADILRKADDAELRAASAEAQAEAARTAKGSHGLRASGLRTKKEVVITDPVALVRHYHKYQEVIALCHRLAKADVRAGASEDSIEGIAIKEVREIA